VRRSQFLTRAAPNANITVDLVIAQLRSSADTSSTRWALRTLQGVARRPAIGPPTGLKAVRVAPSRGFALAGRHGDERYVS